MSGITSLTARTLHTFVGSSGRCFRMLMVPCSRSCGTETRKPFVIAWLPFSPWQMTQAWTCPHKPMCWFRVDWKPILTYATFGCKTSAGCFYPGSTLQLVTTSGINPNVYHRESNWGCVGLESTMLAEWTKLNSLSLSHSLSYDLSPSWATLQGQDGS